MPIKTHLHIATAACRTELGKTAPTEVRLLPAGRFKARDGRPQGIAEGWLINDASAQRVLAAARARNDDLVIDYEHQTLLAEKNGQPAPAAAWVKNAALQWRPGNGLYATGIEWTAAAKAAIEAGEYRYLSPVLSYHPKTGEVQSILMAALTNYPAIDGLADLAARAAARFSLDQPEDSTVDHAQLCALLGLSVDADAAAITAAVAALKAAAGETAALKTEVAALKTAGPDLAKYVPIDQIEALKTQVAALKTTEIEREVNTLVTAALTDGRLLAVQEDWARKLGTKDIADLKAYLEKTPAIAALKGTQSGGKEPVGQKAGELTDSQLAICKATGIEPEDYKKSLKVADDAR